jgi:hypothetical protein
LWRGYCKHWIVWPCNITSSMSCIWAIHLA